MAAEKDDKSMSAEISAQREMECRRRVEEILNPKKETAEKQSLHQVSYPRMNDQAPFGDHRKLGKKPVLERGERSTPNITNRAFHATQKPWQRSNLQILEKRKNGPMPHSRSFMPPSWGASAAPDRVRVSANPISIPKPSLSASDQAGINGGSVNIFCSVCRVHCSGTSNYKQHLSGKQHKAKVISGQLNKVAAGGIDKKKGDEKHPKCELCGIWCTDENSLQMHLSGRKHKAKMLDSRGLGHKEMDA